MNSSLVVNLGGEVVLEYTELFDLVLNNEGLFVVEAQSGEGGERGGLVEHVQISDGELLVHGVGALELE